MPGPAPTPDWDRLLAQVVLATGIDYSLIKEWTLRQLWEVVDESQRQSEEVEAVRQGKPAPPAPPPSTNGVPPSEALKKPAKETRRVYTNWGEKIKGMGYEKHACWNLTQEEKDCLIAGEDPQKHAPFLVPRDIAQERIFRMIEEQWAAGRLDPIRVIDSETGQSRMVKVPVGDRDAMLRFANEVWQKDCERYEAALASRIMGGK